jgi:hypothetical protein
MTDTDKPIMEEKRVFEHNGVKYAVRRPTFDEIIKANEERAKAFNDALQRGDMLRDQLEEELRRRSLWTDKIQARYESLRQDVIDGDFKLSKGGISLAEAREIALKMSDARKEMVELLSSRSDLDSNTCEGKADTVRFNYLYSACLVYEDSGEPYFKGGIADYILQQESPIVIKGATEFYYLLSSSDESQAKTREESFLLDYGFVNENGQFIDKEGRLTDREGRHIDEFGNFIKWTSKNKFDYVDADGRPVDKDKGTYNIEFSPFLDDTGSPVILEKDKPKKRGRPKKKAEEPELEKNESEETETVASE